MASTYSRMRGPGGENGAEKRRSTCARTCVPSPATKRPPVASASIHAAWAVSIGLRGNATATLVPRASDEVASAAAVHIENTGWLPSGSHRASKPAASTSRATSCIWAGVRAVPNAERAGRRATAGWSSTRHANPSRARVLRGGAPERGSTFSQLGSGGRSTAWRGAW